MILEVYRKVTSSVSEEKGLAAISYLSQFEVQSLTREIAVAAGDLSLEYKLGTADSLILAHAHESSCEPITLDNDLRGLPRVVVLP